MHGTKYKRRLMGKTRLDKTSHSIPRLSYLSNISNKHSVLYSIPMVCGSALLLLGLAWINPVTNMLGGFGSNVSDKTYAEEVTSTGTAISLSIDGLGENGDEVESIASSVNAMDSDTAYISHNVTVSASNIENYILQVTSADGSSNSLEHNVSSFTITPTSSTTLEDNTWGYGWSETGDDVSSISYYGLPVYGASNISMGKGLLEAGNADSNGNVDFTKKLTFGAKFSNVPAGHYTATALLSLAASPREILGLGFAGYTTMQEITKAKCDDIPEGTEGRLRDTRDDKIYWVAKIKNTVDNNALCWMTQNLDYDGYGAPRTNFASGTEGTAQYYNPGNYVYINGSTVGTECSPSLNNGYKNCNGWKEVDADVIANANLAQDSAEAIELHYHAGNYYNWITATYGTGASSMTSGNASGSICPAGWSLPLSGTSNNIDGSFYKLMGDSVGKLTDAQITSAPYYFVRGGLLDKDTIAGISDYGRYWSATALANNRANDLLFRNGSVLPSSNGYRYYGMSVRCVVR